jgi:hypothetical protein
MNKRIEDAIKRHDRSQGHRYAYRCYPKKYRDKLLTSEPNGDILRQVQNNKEAIGDGQSI